MELDELLAHDTPLEWAAWRLTIWLAWAFFFEAAFLNALGW